MGIAPAGKVTYPGGPDAGNLQDAGTLDPNHTHFALAASDQWGGETPMLFALAEEMKETYRIPVVVILANGGAVAQSEALHAVRHGWPIISMIPDCVPPSMTRACRSTAARAMPRLNSCSRRDLFRSSS